MPFDAFSFGSLQIDGVAYEHDVVIDRGEIRKRKRKTKPSKKFREEYGHTPLSAEEEIPWKCRRLVVGTGAYGRLPVMDDVKLEAERRKVELVLLPTTEAIKALKQGEQPAPRSEASTTTGRRTRAAPRLAGGPGRGKRRE
jgi:hypothetical protein